MRLIFSIMAMVAGSNAFAAPAQCLKYSATLVKMQKEITILTHAAEYVQGRGFTDVGTSVSGFVNASCETFYLGEDNVCGLLVKNVKVISDTDCWE